MADASLLARAPHLTAAWRRQYVQRLTRWFASHQRDLPWRKTDDPYAIWLSESMLQQTQVATVIDYYHRFLKRFPDVRSLAQADEEAVLAQWAGLGYYRRARQLHAAARQVVDDHAGVFPSELDQLTNLPGVGRYTAGAVRSIAFDKPAPIVEANTERLYARLIGLTDPPRSPVGQQLLWEFAQWQLPRGAAAGSRTINQAAMELGSLVCKPLKPLCSQCPLESQCPTAAAGLQASIPAPKPKKTFSALHHVALIIPRENRWLVRVYPPGAWWTGLWDFPRVDITQRQGAVLAPPACGSVPTANATIEKAALSQLGLTTEVVSPLFQFTHGVTRYRVRVDCVEAAGAHFSGLDDAATPEGWLWANFAELAQLPLTSPARKILSRLAKAPS
jgi:A/G-specific adenine glycosylase